MRFSVPIGVGLLAATCSASAEPECASLYIIAVRGTGESAAAQADGLFPENTGSAGIIAVGVESLINDSEVVGVPYPATYESTSGYEHSEGIGAAAFEKVVNDYHSKCPNGKMAFIGYSQGAQVVMDGLCGGVGGGFNEVPPLSPKMIESNVVASVVFGDPSHIAGKPYDSGNSTHDGLVARKNTTVCDKYADRMLSLCDADDKYCDSGKSLAVHTSYQANNATLLQMGEFILKKYKQSGNSTASATGTSFRGTSTGTSTKTATGSTTSPTGAAACLSAGQSFILAAPLMMAAVLPLL